MKKNIASMANETMNAVTASKAGVASGILSMSRMVGGTFGVAAIGALFQSLSKDRLSSDLASAHLTASQHSAVTDALGGGDATSALKGLEPGTAQDVARAMKDAFVHGLSGSLKLSTAVAEAGAVLAFVLVEPKLAARRQGDAAHAEAQAAEPTAPTAEAERAAA